MPLTQNKDSTNMYFIAEIGVNHEGSILKAKDMILQAAKAGAHAAKFQVYKAEKLVVKDAKSYWDTSEESETSQLALFKKYDGFGKAEYTELFDYCSQLGIDFLATPFDVDCLEWLDPLTKFYKIASADLNNFELLHAVAQFKKHVIMSVGASTFDEVEKSIEFLFKNGCPSITILHCVLNYPCSINNSFLSHICSLQERFNNNSVDVGYSDHVPSSEASDDQLIAALVCGCRVFERHFTFDVNLPGNDHYHALDGNSLKSIISRMNIILPSLKNFSEQEVLEAQRSAILQARRSIVMKKDKKAGELISKDDIICKRPGNGIPASDFFEIIGKTLRVSLIVDTPLKYEDLL
ncbi:N-acetylneuraminate synthase family protein [Amylibacter sp.]|nr:N-acetylneuraminate synthase family protein [Amylibacter sp.]